MIRKYYSMAMTMAALTGANAYAAVSAEEAKQLGGPVLTLFGAEKAGNKEGTIPPYSGEPIKDPPGYDRKNNPGNYVDPWNDKPLFSITAQNADKYADQIDGMRKLFNKYPNYRMDIYQSRRHMNFPKDVLSYTVKNATSCKAVNDELVLEGCYAGYPFPIPKSGAQVMWNRLMSYESRASNTNFEAWVVSPDGKATMQTRSYALQNYPYYDPSRSVVNGPKDIYWQARIDNVAPARKYGEKIVLIDHVDALNIGRRAYQYIPGQRRVKLSPDLSYDTPNPWSGGAMTMDDTKLYTGAMDRYKWKLVGKKEKYILSNMYSSTNPQICGHDKFFTKDFPNPECQRFEMHRVWVVEANLKEGFRHIYTKRIFYLDEDGYVAGSAENYDASGQLFRIVQGHAFPFYNNEGNYSGPNYDLDLVRGGWVISGFHADPGLGIWPRPILANSIYSPEALAGEGIR